VATVDANKRLFAKIADLTLLQVANHVPAVIAVAIAARALGAASFGVYARMASAAAIVALVVNFGFSLTGVRAASLAGGVGEGLSRIFSEVMAAKALLAASCLVVGALVGFVVQPGGDWFAFASFAFVYGVALALAPTWVFIAVHRVDRLIGPVVVVRVAAVLLVWLLVRESRDVWLYLGLTVGLEVTLVAWLWLRTHGFGIRLLRPSRTAVQATLRGSLPVFGAAAAINLYTASGPLIVGVAIGNEAAGYYGLADRIRQLVLGALGTVSQAIYPTACRVAAGLVEYREELRRGVGLLLALAAAASAAVLLTAGPVIHVMGGAEYEPAVVLLRWMAALPLLVTFSGIVGNFQLVAHGFNAEFTAVATITALVGVPLLFALARGQGLPGVGVALLVTEVVAAAGMLAMARRRKLRSLP
jgi:O-antigen/teichoic acid export membrane protein